MPRIVASLLAAGLGLALPAAAPAASAGACGGPVEASVEGTAVGLHNGCISWSWSGGTLATEATIDHRESGPTPSIVSTRHADFALVLDGARIPSDAMPIAEVTTDSVPGGIRVRWRLGVPGVAEVIREAEMYEGIAGLRARTTVTSLAPAALSGYTLQELAPAGPGHWDSTIHSMRAGADWRDEEGWEPGVAVGDSHTGTWRQEQHGSSGPNAGTGQWLSLARIVPRRHVALVMERRDYASSWMSFDRDVARAEVDLSRDVVYTGPFESDIHAENPGPGPARHRALIPGRPLELEPVFVAFGTDADDEAWQFHRYLTGHRLTPYRRGVAFNTNRIDSNEISTGAKDDVNFARMQKTLVPAAREMGIDTFILDDGWQARSGDWCPDSDACPEPRRDADPKFAGRFPDPEFAAVRELLAGDPGTAEDDIALGLWMTPMAFHPSSKAFQTNPQWSCMPVGTATGAGSFADDGGSFDAGIGLWNPLAMGVDPDDGATPMRNVDYIEGRVLRAIETYGATYFKFDFLVWVDCGGAEPVTQYEYRDAFVAMVDRLQAAHPEVTFEIDETNDYRMFPYESVARGPSWFLNGSPSTVDQLHTLWTLAPYVPGFSIGQAATSNGTDLRGNETTPAKGIDKTTAVSLTSHVTMWPRIDTDFSAAERAQVKRWTDFYTEHAAELGTFTFPLLQDPRARGWTALQPWDVDARAGWVLAYRQEAPEATQRIPLRGLGGVPDGAPFRLTSVDPATGASTDLGTRTAAELRAGLPVTVEDPWYGYALIRVEPA